MSAVDMLVLSLVAAALAAAVILAFRARKKRGGGCGCGCAGCTGRCPGAFDRRKSEKDKDRESEKK